MSIGKKFALSQKILEEKEVFFINNIFEKRKLYYASNSRRKCPVNEKGISRSRLHSENGEHA